MWREAIRGYPKPVGYTRIPSDMDLGFYFSSPLKMGMSIGISKLYRFGFRKSKIRPTCPVAMPSRNLSISKVSISKPFKHSFFNQIIGTQL
jgi:hypothetical protein